MNTKQAEALAKIQNRQNVFLTGAAGTGKSFVIHKVIEWAKGLKMEVGVTASTGQAACLLRDRTVHSFLGIGLANKSVKTMIAELKKWKLDKFEDLQRLQLLIIDEISMINNELLDIISEYLSKIRENELAFGGCQIVLCGDFCQLPPVEGKYCFLAASWKAANINTVLLEELVRQDGDPLFQRILDKIRWGDCSNETLAILSIQQNKEFAYGIVPTKLYSINADVDRINQREYDALVAGGAPTKIYKTLYSSGRISKAWAESVKIPEAVELCMGAQIVVTWNVSFDDGIVNGTRGVVCGLNDKSVVIRLSNGKETTIDYIKMVCEFDETIKVRYIPLKLAYAFSIHKSQGMTLDAVELDLGSTIFEYGQAYTALSRARSLDSIKISHVAAKSFKTHKIVKKLYGVAY